MEKDKDVFTWDTWLVDIERKNNPFRIIEMDLEKDSPKYLLGNYDLWKPNYGDVVVVESLNDNTCCSLVIWTKDWEEALSKKWNIFNIKIEPFLDRVPNLIKNEIVENITISDIGIGIDDYMISEYDEDEGNSFFFTGGCDIFAEALYYVLKGFRLNPRLCAFGQGDHFFVLLEENGHEYYIDADGVNDKIECNNVNLELETNEITYDWCLNKSLNYKETGYYILKLLHYIKKNKGDTNGGEDN